MMHKSDHDMWRSMMEHDDELLCDQIEVHKSLRCVHGVMMQMYVVHLLEGRTKEGLLSEIF